MVSRKTSTKYKAKKVRKKCGGTMTVYVLKKKPAVKRKTKRKAVKRKATRKKKGRKKK